MRKEERKTEREEKNCVSRRKVGDAVDEGERGVVKGEVAKREVAKGEVAKGEVKVGEMVKRDVGEGGRWKKRREIF